MAFWRLVLRLFEIPTACGACGERRDVDPTTWTWGRSTRCVRTFLGLFPRAWPDLHGSEGGTCCSGEFRDIQSVISLSWTDQFTVNVCQLAGRCSQQRWLEVGPVVISRCCARVCLDQLINQFRESNVNYLHNKGDCLRTCLINVRYCLKLRSADQVCAKHDLFMNSGAPKGHCL